MGGFLTVVSMKFNRTPLLHVRLDFRQFAHAWLFAEYPEDVSVYIHVYQLTPTFITLQMAFSTGEASSSDPLRLARSCSNRSSLLPNFCRS